MIRIKTITVFFLFLACFLFFSSPAFCRESKVKDTVNTFYDSVEQGDRASLLATLSPDVVKKIKMNPSGAGEPGKIYKFTEAVKKGKIRIRFKERKIDVDISSPTKAEAEVNMTFVVEMVKSGKTRERISADHLFLVCKNGRWLIESIKFTNKQK